MCQVARESISDIASAPHCDRGDKSRGSPYQEHSDKSKSVQRDAQDKDSFLATIQLQPERTHNAHLGYLSLCFGSQRREESVRVLWLDVLRLDARVCMALELATILSLWTVIVDRIEEGRYGMSVSAHSHGHCGGLEESKKQQPSLDWSILSGQHLNLQPQSPPHKKDFSITAR